ncbi:MAG: hypothetical protein AAB393_15780, partial [Bacteroidota bacterium]
ILPCSKTRRSREQLKECIEEDDRAVKDRAAHRHLSARLVVSENGFTIKRYMLHNQESIPLPVVTGVFP